MMWRLTVSAITRGGVIDPEKLVTEMNKIIDRFDAGGKLRHALVKATINVGSVPESPYPLRLQIGDVNWRPSAVVVARIRRLNGSGSTPIYSGPIVDWENGRAGEVSIKYVAGLEANTKYEVTFLVMGDE